MKITAISIGYSIKMLHQKKPLRVLRSPSSKDSYLSWTFTINSIHPDPIHLEGFLEDRFQFQLRKFSGIFIGQAVPTAKSITYPDDLSYCAFSYYVREAGSP
ncbi:hypothetical protein AVEN_237327-1 [Araneus ventricosus]|uniref:Uncharacterized protein n=1 Tax=Araneus ventricosus TaxID=182803 RepID=A0A4Y2ICD2_ARAVE|nr:hypothetical protein AVEN_237327-1 [Araneus ventricosus]